MPSQKIDIDAKSEHVKRDIRELRVATEPFLPRFLQFYDDDRALEAKYEPISEEQSTNGDGS
jgi:uncharacterized damage-inducible protein DinB